MITVSEARHTLMLLSLLLAQNLFAHGHHAHDGAAQPLKTWTLPGEKIPLQASFFLFKNNKVYLEKADGDVVDYPLEAFSEGDQAFVRQKAAEIARLNDAAPVQTPAPRHPAPPPTGLPFALLAFGALAGFLFWRISKKTTWALALGAILGLYAFKTEIAETLFGTDPHFVDTAFEPFKPNVATHWDATWFYVESKGIPTTHSMMTGITAWQQQVPIPQCYLGANAWQIPLNPVFADTPVPVNPQHFLRGAVAIAANGVPIFNPYTNTGVDAFLDGQLDQWGGHSGRADDYHYHTAPLHLDAQTPDVLPIAFALDGFAVYGSLEPDGSPMLPLDANHGHTDPVNGYHYHGTPAAPYMIGRMVGQVTEDATLQIIPQPKATPVRPSLTPLSGAVITNFQPNAGGNGYILTYTRNGQTYQVDYSWTNAGVYTYRFISPAGTTTETYNGFVPCQVPVATNDLQGQEFEVIVFPNPTTGSFSLAVALHGAETLEMVRAISLFDTGGKPAFHTTGPGPVFEVDALPRGVYFLKIQLESGVVSRKILVQ